MGTSFKSTSWLWYHDDKTALVRQTSHSTRTIFLAFSLVFQVKYFRSRATARNTFTIITNMETKLRKRKRWCGKTEIVANIFPFIQSTLSTPQRKYTGTLMSALNISANARLAIRMFGKVQSFLNRAMTARTKPFPRAAKIATNGRSISMEIVMEEKFSTSMMIS